LVKLPSALDGINIFGQKGIILSLAVRKVVIATLRQSEISKQICNLKICCSCIYFSWQRVC